MFSYPEIARVLSNEPYGQHLHYFRSTSSTNSEAIRLAAAGAPEGTLVVADEQTAGRGRAGRRWYTPPGSGLAASLVLRPVLSSGHIGHLALLGGVATAQAIESLSNLQPQLKWPNDIFINGKKVAGILGESSFSAAALEWVVLGIGINVNAGPPEDASTRNAASFLANHSGHILDRVRLLLELVRAVAENYPHLGTKTLITAWENRMIWRGERVRVLNEESASIEGTVLGLSQNGELRLSLDNGRTLTISAGDISLIRI